MKLATNLDRSYIMFCFLNIKKNQDLLWNDIDESWVLMKNTLHSLFNGKGIGKLNGAFRIPPLVRQYVDY